MTDAVYPVPKEWADHALIDADRYEAMYRESVEDPDAFWMREAARLDWMRPFSRTKETSFHKDDFGIRWFADGTLNLSANCLDRHLDGRRDDVAILWEPDDPSEDGRSITYGELHEMVCKFANVLKANGAAKGDRVTIYMPMIPEAAVAMLACARIGAIHSVVFGGFSPEALAGRIQDCDSELVITADEGRRGGKPIPLKANVDEALDECPSVQRVIVFRHTGAQIPMKTGRDVDWAEAMSGASAECEPEEMGAEDPLFILYTSGSTGKPKGVLHTTGGYAVWASMTHH